MVAQVFIDGEVGTTGLQIRERLSTRPDISLVQIDYDKRKDPDTRRKAYQNADIAILCLPDEAARQAIELSSAFNTRIIDASTAHRTDPRWTFGFAELNTSQREKISKAKYVSNPGCWSTGAIALLAPLVDAKLITPNDLITISGVSGYSGGGKTLIDEFETNSNQRHFVYGLEHNHKHLPEIKLYSALAHTPIFIPSVGAFAQGMIVQIPLHLKAGQHPKMFHDALEKHYEKERFIRLISPDEMLPRANPEALNGTNMLKLAVMPAQQGDRLVLLALLDNLGKGASGAAVQNLNIMLGLDEGLGL